MRGVFSLSGGMAPDFLQNGCHDDLCRNSERECYRPINKSTDLNTLGIVGKPFKDIDEVDQFLVEMGMSRGGKAVFEDTRCPSDSDVMFQACCVDDFDVGGKHYVKVKGGIESLAMPDENLNIANINEGCTATHMPMRQLSSKAFDGDALSLPSFFDDSEVRGTHNQNIKCFHDDLCRNSERECYRPSNKSIDLNTLGIAWNPFKDIDQVDQYLAGIGMSRFDKVAFEENQRLSDTDVMFQASRVDDFDVGDKSYVKIRGEIDSLVMPGENLKIEKINGGCTATCMPLRQLSSQSTDVDSLSVLSFSDDSDADTWSRKTTSE